ncbi:hypothetical protein [Tateyamaria sp. ANG-S1]|uniref:hypothetical protein n=1 Tax=Tateyamaria sp. ANG-S1 TaxID=1577905 RepID=UPI00057F7AAE|nr:hypothetical protein [Tateyamaria sp. ANG-S1]KIC50975.1 hypothetical protein RA29_03565 [Tateyamaria sp. ANG-S1]
MFKIKSKNTETSGTFSEFGTVLKVNGRFLLAATLAHFAWRAWPSEAEHWGFVFVSFCFGAVAIGQVVHGLRDLIALLKRESVIGKQVKDAMTAKHAREVTRDVLEDAGMK